MFLTFFKNLFHVVYVTHYIIGILHCHVEILRIFYLIPFSFFQIITSSIKILLFTEFSINSDVTTYVRFVLLKLKTGPRSYLITSALTGNP